MVRAGFSLPVRADPDLPHAGAGQAAPMARSKLSSVMWAGVVFAQGAEGPEFSSRSSTSAASPSTQADWK